MMSEVKRCYVGANIRVLEWPKEKFSCNNVPESKGVLMVRVYTRRTGVEDEATDQFTVENVHVSPFNLDYYLLSRNSSVLSQSLLYWTIKSTLAFLGGINARALSQLVFSNLFSNFHFTCNMLNSRKSKIIIVVDIFVDGLMDANHVSADMVEVLRNNRLDIVSMLRYFLDIELPIDTDESTVLAEIEARVKTKKLIDEHDDHHRSPADKCPICLQEFLTEKVVASTPCSHVFHSDCLLQWLLKNNSCPMCRSPCSTTVHI